ncbi:hypothetical protein [Sigmofec virus UA08Rod_6581]|uniref:Uncharacterized protein n=1 Tax=Sigmofec virus UA08Rod_6581 TaxID=2929235 RepID=A0A976R8G0_9VIRU|nr:hypothetical protein [Sigmofec virus UA08Rod_6581]
MSYFSKYKKFELDSINRDISDESETVPGQALSTKDLMRILSNGEVLPQRPSIDEGDELDLDENPYQDDSDIPWSTTDDELREQGIFIDYESKEDTSVHKQAPEGDIPDNIPDGPGKESLGD